MLGRAQPQNLQVICTAGATTEPAGMCSIRPFPLHPAPGLTLLLQVGGAEAQARQHHLAGEAPQLRRLLLALEQAAADEAQLHHGQVAQLVRLLRKWGERAGWLTRARGWGRRSG